MKQSKFLSAILLMCLFSFSSFAQKMDSQQSDDMVKKVQRAKQKAEIAKIFAERVAQNKEKLDAMEPGAAKALKEKWYEEAKVKNGWYDFDENEQKRYLEEQVYGGNRDKQYRAKKSGRKIMWDISAPKGQKRPPLYDVYVPEGEEDPFVGTPYGNDYLIFDAPDKAFDESLTPLEQLKLQKAAISKGIRAQYQEELEENPKKERELKAKFSDLRSDILKALKFEEAQLQKQAEQDRRNEEYEQYQREQLEVIGKEGDIFNKDGKLLFSEGERVKQEKKERQKKEETRDNH